MNQHTLPLTHIDDMTAASLKSAALIAMLRNYLSSDPKHRDTLNDDVLECMVWQIQENLYVIDDGLAAAIESQRIGPTDSTGIDEGARS